jgi:hypothetical protein
VGVFNRRNAVTGWVTLKLGKWVLRRKAKKVQLNPLARRRAAKAAKPAKGGKGSKR